MIGILLITHDRLGEALIECVSHVMNRRPERVAQIAVGADEDPHRVLQRAREMLHAIDEGQGVIILTDIYGATPANIAMKLIQPGRTEVVTGVNVSMLLRILTYREKSDIGTVVQKAITGACDGVIHVKGRI